MASNADFEVSFDGILYSSGETGIGDLGLRSKINVLNQDKMLLSLTSFINFPTSTNGAGSDNVVFGVFVPFTYAFQEQTRLTLMPALSFIKVGDYHAQLSLGAKIAQDLNEKVGAFAEFVFAKYLQDGSTVITALGLGLYFDVDTDTQIFASAHFGLSDAVPDVSPGLGGALRF